MNKVTSNIYANFEFPPQNFPEKRNVKAAIVGSSGIGKTTLFNSICKTEHQTGISHLPLTINTLMETCKYVGTESLTLYDIPSIPKDYSLYSSNKSAFETDYKQIINGGCDLVIIMAKLDSRFEDRTISQLRQIRKTLRKLSKASINYIFMISQLDIAQDCNQKDEILSGIQKSLKRLNMTGRTLAYSNKKCDFAKLAEIIYFCSLDKQEEPQLQKLLCYDLNSEADKPEKVTQNEHSSKMIFIEVVWSIVVYIITLLRVAPSRLMSTIKSFLRFLDQRCNQYFIFRQDNSFKKQYANSFKKELCSDSEKQYLAVNSDQCENQ